MDDPENALDPYLDPATGVLVNRLGLGNADRLTQKERAASLIRDVELTLRPEPGGFDLAHLCRIHRRLFADVYPWAGELRVCQLSRSAPFAHPAFIAEQAGDVFRALARERHLAAEAGWRLDRGLIDPERNDTASRQSLSGAVEPLRHLIDEITHPL